MSTKTLMAQLEEYQVIPYRKLVLQILKHQQQTIREQKELIETLWAWAEEKDETIEEEPEQKKREVSTQSDKYLTCYEKQTGSQCTNNDSTFDASVYTKIM